jgi:hypothetical protein
MLNMFKRRRIKIRSIPQRKQKAKKAPKKHKELRAARESRPPAPCYAGKWEDSQKRQTQKMIKGSKHLLKRQSHLFFINLNPVSSTTLYPPGSFI